MKPLISQLAEDDLACIYGYLLARNPDAAERFKTQAEKALAQLGEHPELGPRPGWETHHTELRFWVISQFHNYLIYYQTRENGVSIERVLDGRRNVRRLIEERIQDPPP